MNTSAKCTTSLKNISTLLHYKNANPAAKPPGVKFWVPTLGECSHEEVVEIASHLGELPLAPFPALAHLGAAVLEAEVMIVMVLLVG